MKNTISKFTGPTSAAMLAMMLFGFTASAQNINWGTPQALTGDSDLLTSGIYFDAFIPEYTSTALIAAGVTFNSDSALTASGGGDGIISYSWSGGGNTRYDFAGTFTLGSAGFNAVMEAGGAYVNGVGSGSVTISGLTAGNTYLLQEFEYDNGNGGATILGGATPATITGGSTGGQGEYVTGTFTATGTTASFSLTGDAGTAFTVLGAISVRDITAVPEPSTTALFVGSLMLGGLSLIRRREFAS